jgi:flagellar biosynthesis/type III secretory pathway M-ring protein FliF/YscJ
MVRIAPRINPNDKSNDLNASKDREELADTNLQIIRSKSASTVDIVTWVAFGVIILIILVLIIFF